MKDLLHSKIKKRNLVFIYFVDKNRTFYPSVKEKLSNEKKYKVDQFMSVDALCNYLRTTKIDKTQANIIFLYAEMDKSGKSEKENLIANVKKLNGINTGLSIFILTNLKDNAAHNDLISSGVEGIIPKNESSVIRIQNRVKGLISERNLEKKKKERLLPLKILLIFILLVLISAVVAYMVNPEIFYT